MAGDLRGSTQNRREFAFAADGVVHAGDTWESVAGLNAHPKILEWMPPDGVTPDGAIIDEIAIEPRDARHLRPTPNAPLQARVIDRLSLRPLHNTPFAGPAAESCLWKPGRLNGYTFPRFASRPQPAAIARSRLDVPIVIDGRAGLQTRTARRARTMKPASLASCPDPETGPVEAP